MPKCIECSSQAELNHYNFCEECVINAEIRTLHINQVAERRNRHSHSSETNYTANLTSQPVPHLDVPDDISEQPQ